MHPQMAATGSGKTTQIPQMVLDDQISKGVGGSCNIIVTQPRRLAAISVAQRMAAERGEQVGQTIGYQVRFEQQYPERDGSILLCTTGIFLKRMQQVSSSDRNILENTTHVIVDEVHERDVDVDLLLFVLRRQLEDRRKSGRAPFKIILK